MIPASIKALDRLIGAGIDIPVAWLAQKKAQIEAQTQSYTTVEKSISSAAAAQASGDVEIIERAKNVLVRKAYRNQINREAVAAAMIEDMQTEKADNPDSEAQSGNMASIDEDWLNVFERYAEDASTERMQKLWGRVLAGEIRRPGRFAARTLRFLSEFSQKDAFSFANFCENAFRDYAPSSLVKDGKENIRDLIDLESAGLIQGASGLGLTQTFNFNDAGQNVGFEGNIGLLLISEPSARVAIQIVSITPLGQELINFIPERDSRAAARKIAFAIRTPMIKEAHLLAVAENHQVIPMELLWRDQEQSSQDTSAAA